MQEFRNAISPFHHFRSILFVQLASSPMRDSASEFRLLSHAGQHSTGEICPFYLRKTENTISEATHHRFVSIIVWLLVKGADSSTVQKPSLPATEGGYVFIC